MDILDFINELRSSDGYIEHIYTKGSCYKFHILLSKMYKGSVPYISGKKDHIITRYKGRYYDINGEVTCLDGYTKLKEGEVQIVEKWSFYKHNLLKITECPSCDEPLTFKEPKIKRDKIIFESKTQIKKKELIGTKHDKLTVIREVVNPEITKLNDTMFVCKCDCGNEVRMKYKRIKTPKNKKSCGDCKFLPPGHSKYKHNGKKSPTYTTYRSMIDRCTNPKHTRYGYYGGRGITICDRWMGRIVGFKNFLEDMGERPDGMTIDRINVNGNYEPSNCRWATASTQLKNRRKIIKPIAGV